MTVDYSQRKQVKQSRSGYVLTLYRAKCEICDKCWWSPDTGQCIYGGPYSGYEGDACTAPTSEQKSSL